MIFTKIDSEDPLFEILVSTKVDRAQNSKEPKVKEN